MDSSVYTRPKKPKSIFRERRDDIEKPDFSKTPEPVVVDATTECHVTPPEIAARMVDYLDYEMGGVLEPSCGTGNLIQAMLEHDFYIDPADITAIERHHNLVEVCERRFNNEIYPIQADFLEYEPPKNVLFDYVLMNPPFKKVKQHIEKALSMLSAGGVLVAIVPITYQNPKMVELEILSNSTFPTAKVNAKIIRIFNP